MDKKEEIMHVTYEMFAEKGYNTSMSDIAKAVGIKVPSIYSHFQSKEEIIYLVMNKEIGNYFETLNKKIKSLGDEGCENKLSRIYEWVFEYFDKPEKIRFWKNISLIYQQELKAKCRKLVRNEELKIMKLLTDIFKQGCKEGWITVENIDGEVLLYWTMIQGVLDEELMCYDTDQNAENYKTKIWQAYMAGIRVKKLKI